MSVFITNVAHIFPPNSSPLNPSPLFSFCYPNKGSSFLLNPSPSFPSISLRPNTVLMARFASSFWTSSQPSRIFLCILWSFFENCFISFLKFSFIFVFEIFFYKFTCTTSWLWETNPLSLDYSWLINKLDYYRTFSKRLDYLNSILLLLISWTFKIVYYCYWWT